jgi:hypothetical protein
MNAPMQQERGQTTLRATGTRRLTTDKNIEPVPHWGKKNSLESCLVYLGRWDVKRNGHAKTSALLIHERNELRGCALLKACRVPAVFRYH